MSKPIAIITGGGRGIGRETALLLARQQGYGIVIVGRTKAEVDQTAADAGDALAVVADIAKSADCGMIVERALSWHGRIDALINNAGCAVSLPVEMTTDEQFDQVIQTNLAAPFRLSRACWGVFVEQKRGVIVNLSSISARDPLSGFHAYGASKAGLNTLGISLAREGAAHGIRVHTIAPGAVETGMFRSIVDEKTWPKERTLPPAEVAKMIVACVTGELQYTSGEVIYMRHSPA